MYSATNVPDSVEECLGLPLVAKSYRGSEWEQFAGMVKIHIESYTIAQYGDGPDDPVEEWSAEDCIKQVQRYANRFGRNQRGMQDQLLDLKKAAHYLCLAYFKLQEKAFVK